MERLTDAQWALVEPHLPKRMPSAKGGRPPADDRACFEGVLWILRTGARWKDLPKEYPSPATCWRRLAQLDHQGQLDWSEAFMDGTFAPAKKGGLASERHAKARGQSAWYWSTARVFLSECTFQLRPPRNTRSRSQRSKPE